eukprot:3844217-Amphidinium_carterae.2
MHRLISNRYQHDLREYAIWDGTQHVGALVACQKCGAYLFHCSKYLKKDCAGPRPDSAALRRQQSRIQGCQHSLAKRCCRGYTLHMTREVKREDVMHGMAEVRLMHEVYV